MTSSIAYSPAAGNSLVRPDFPRLTPSKPYDPLEVGSRAAIVFRETAINRAGHLLWDKLDELQGVIGQVEGVLNAADPDADAALAGELPSEYIAVYGNWPADTLAYLRESLAPLKWVVQKIVNDLDCDLQDPPTAAASEKGGEA